jgi:hypothetical protein
MTEMIEYNWDFLHRGPPENLVSRQAAGSGLFRAHRPPQVKGELPEVFLRFISLGESIFREQSQITFPLRL